MYCNPLKKPCVYNIVEDPCELEDISDKYPNYTEALLTILEDYNMTAVAPGNLPMDPCGFPKYWSYTWTNFGDLMNESVREMCQEELKS